ncbi:MAG TPA: GNAT family N-acetyltransferase [Actinomycetes bacterium]|jgi:GNAT superfamily N-acetyltransferase|nr:GNAT family N-acetyltransferase [Actinomycetes bacterium]
MALRDVAITAEPLSSPAAAALIERLDAELTERYPNPEDNHFELTDEQVGEGRGVFLVARVAGRPVGCGALRRLDGVTGEIKRMYVAPLARRAGVGRRLLAELERHARRLGLHRLVLETGERQPEAIRLYERAGFLRIPAFGEYVESPASVCMGKAIHALPPAAESTHPRSCGTGGG